MKRPDTDVYIEAIRFVDECKKKNNVPKNGDLLKNLCKRIYGSTSPQLIKDKFIRELRFTFDNVNKDGNKSPVDRIKGYFMGHNYREFVSSSPHHTLVASLI